MNQARQAIAVTLLATTIISIGVAGYMIIEGWSFPDAIYMTIITLSTVGYEEIHKLSDSGRLFTMFYIMIGVGSFLYGAAYFVQFMVEGRMREVLGRRMLENKINKMKNHYIVCGYGRIGNVLCRHLLNGGEKLVVIERNEKHAPKLEQDDLLYISAEATDEDALIKAGIHRAKGVVAALGTDADNVFVVLTTRQLNPSLFIMARANVQSSTSKLFAAGSDKVISPHDIGAKRMAEGILRPNVTDFLDLASRSSENDINMEEIPIAKKSRLAGVTLAESNIRQDLNLIVIAIKKSDGKMLFNPPYDARMTPGDTVIAVGANNNLASLEKIFNPN